MSGRALEQAMLREVLHTTAAVEHMRKLGDELIAASREVISAWHEVRRLRIVRSPTPRMTEAIERLAQLVGKP